MIGHPERYEDFDTSGEPALPRPPATATVVVIDRGPILPTDVPKPPDNLASPAQWLDYHEDAARHVALVLQYRRERSAFTQQHGDGPVKIETDPVSAREMIERGGGRYILKRGANS
jgi:hypothetical protein